MCVHHTLQRPLNSTIFSLQGQAKAEQISHPVSEPGCDRHLPRDNGHPLSEHEDRHELRSEREHSGEITHDQMVQQHICGS